MKSFWKRTKKKGREQKEKNTQRAMFCKVHACPHALFHVTSDHHCRLCQQKGHGTYECSNRFLRQALEPFLEEELPSSNHCQFPSCPRARYHISEAHFCRECKHVVPCPHMTFGLALGVRSSSKHEKSEEEGKQLICPVCQTQNFIPSHQAKLYHDNPATCVVCYEQPVAVFLPACGHANLCGSCAEKLTKYKDGKTKEDIS